MPINKEVKQARQFSEEEFLSRCKQEESLQLRWEFTCDPRQSVHLDFISMQEGFIPSETVSDIEFLSETNKQYAELGLNERPEQLEKQATDLNNNNNERIPTYMDITFPADQSKGESDDEFETTYDNVTGETKVKLGPWEYIIDTSSHFAETEDSHRDIDAKFTQEIGIAKQKTADVSPVTTSGFESIMFTDDKEQVDATLCHGNWKPDEQVLEDMEFINNQHTMIIPEFERQTNEINRHCVQTRLCKEDELTNLSGPEIKIHTRASLNRSTRCEFQSHIFCTKTLPTFAAFSKSVDSDPCRSNETLSRYSRKKGRNKCDQSKQPLCAAPDCINRDLKTVSDLVSRPEKWPTTHSYESSQRYQTPVENLFETPVKGFACPNTPDVNVQASQSCTQPDGMNCNLKNQNTLQSTDFSPQFSDFIQYGQGNGVWSGEEIAALNSVELQLNERLFESTEPKPKKKWKRGCRLWEYIRNLLLDPSTNPLMIKWVDRDEGTFKLVQNKAIAHMWGMKRGNGDMSYEKLSRAMRYYYKKQIFQPVIGKRLVYKFGPRATGWKESS